MSQLLLRALMMLIPKGAPPGQQAYTTAGTYSWTAPAGVTSVSVVCVGGGPGFNIWDVNGDGLISLYTAPGGGALAYANNITVVPGNTYAVVVDNGTTASSFNSTTVGASCGAQGSSSSNAGGAGGTVLHGTGFAGGAGGNAGTAHIDGDCGGAGGAGGYAGVGGIGGNKSTNSGGANGAGGGGGGGGSAASAFARAGGGVGIFGQGSNGTGGAYNAAGGAGSGGLDATYGGGNGSIGAVRIIWPGTTRSFPSTNTADM